MKIYKSDIIALINEIIEESDIQPSVKKSKLNEEDKDKYQDVIDSLTSKREALKIQVAKMTLDINKVQLARAINNREIAEETLNNAEDKQQDVSGATEALNNSKKVEAEAKKAVSAANDVLNSAKKGGVN